MNRRNFFNCITIAPLVLTGYDKKKMYPMYGIYIDSPHPSKELLRLKKQWEDSFRGRKFNLPIIIPVGVTVKMLPKSIRLLERRRK